MSRSQRTVKRPQRFDDDVHEASTQVGRGGNSPSKRHNRDDVRDGGTSEKGRVGADRFRNVGADLPGDDGIKARTFTHPPVHVHARTRTRACACTRTRTRTRTHTRTRTRTRTRACARARTYTHTRTHVHAHAHVGARTCTYTRTRTHTHTFEVRSWMSVRVCACTDSALPFVIALQYVYF